MTIRSILSMVILFTFISASFQATSQQMLWGMTDGGGDSNSGVIFKTNEDGTGLEAVKSFQTVRGGNPTRNSLIQASNGKLYGMTQGGGRYGAGVLFEYDITSGTYTVKVDFDGADKGRSPQGGVVEASNGKLYCMTYSGGVNGFGVIFEYDPASDVYSKKFDFSTLSGAQPTGDLIQAADGGLWGVTHSGGSTGRGVLFRYDPLNSTYTMKKEFDPSTGMRPDGSQLMVSGKLYGMNLNGGAHNLGTIYEYDITSNNLVVKFNFSNSSNCGYPLGALIKGSDGYLYGITSSGWSPVKGDHTYYYSSLFRFSPSDGSFARMYNTIGKFGNLFQASDGNIYGMIDRSLYVNEKSTFFKLETGNLTTLVSFERDDLMGGASTAGLTQASNGKLYGMTNNGGTGFSGVLFEYDPVTKDYQVKVNFNGSKDGASPMGHLVQGSNGKIYGIASHGGAHSSGVLFEYDITKGVFTRKLDLPRDKGRGVGGMLPASNGKLYGVADGNNGGVLFEYDPSNNQYTKKLYFETVNTADPVGSLIQLPNGKMYGVTRGSYGVNGILFEYDAATNTLVKKVVFDFHGTKAFLPSGSLLYSEGKLYGLTERGGADDTGTTFEDRGTLFEFDPDTDTFTRKIDFDASVTGATPVGSLIRAANNKLYGVTRKGGASNAGVIFEYDPTNGNFVKKIDFTGNPADGLNVQGNFVESSNGKLYATTSTGGNYGKGVLFEYDITTNTITTRQHFMYTDGAYPFNAPLLFISMQQQTITFSSLQEKTYNDPSFALHATTSSGLPVTYTSSNSDVATVVDNMVTIKGAGETIITAYQQGSAHFHSSEVSQTLTINKRDQAITFNTLPEKNTGDMPFQLEAGASSELPVTYSSSDVSVAAIEGNTLSIVGPGISAIAATQTGNNNYLPAPPVSQTLHVNIVLSADDQSGRGIAIYPNPADQVFILELNNVQNKHNIDLYNPLGRTLTVPLESTNEMGKYRCDVREVAEGLYFLKLPGTKSRAIMIVH